MDKKTSTDAKERVILELRELNVKISKLAEFLFGPKLLETKLSESMIKLLWEQLGVMKKYAEILQRRISIWSK